MMLPTLAAVVFAAHLAAPLPNMPGPLTRVQSCGNGYDIDIYGRCYPNGVIPPQFQAARQGRYAGERGPVPCGNGADVDSRDGQCYPTGTVPRRFQAARQGERRYYRRRYW